MREEKNRDTLQSAALGRARMYLKDGLGWLPGFPLAPGERSRDWISVPREGSRPIRRVPLSSGLIQKAVTTFNLLNRHFPRALPRAVDDPAAWKKGVPLLMALIDPVLRRDRPIPKSLLSIEGAYPAGAVRLARELRRSAPFLDAYIDALSYVLIMNPDDLAPSLRWAGLHSEKLKTVLASAPGPEGLLRLVKLGELSRRVGRRETGILVELLGDPRTQACPVEGWGPHIDALREAIVESARLLMRRPIPPAPKPELAGRLFDLVDRALARTAETVRKTLRLLALVLEFDALEEWSAAWKRLAAAPELARRIKAESESERQIQIGKAEARCRALLALRPPELHIEILLEDIEGFAARAPEDVFRAAVKALRAVPPVVGGCAARAALFHEWAAEWRRADPLLLDALREFAQKASAHRDSDAWLRPWSSTFEAWTCGRTWASGLIRDILDQAGDAAAVRSCFEALDKGASARPAGLDEAQARRLIALAAALGDADQALGFAEGLLAAGIDETVPETPMINAARALTPDPAEFGRIIKALSRMDSFERYGDFILRLDRLLREAGWGDVVRQALLADEVGAVIEVAGLYRAAASLKAEIGPPDRARGSAASVWTGQYPPEFAATLSAWAALTPKAERSARAVFGQDFIPGAALRRELAVLEKKIAAAPGDASLVRRASGLRARLRQPARIGAVRSRLIEERLRRAVRRGVFDLWRARLLESLSSRLVQELGAETLPPIFMEPPIQSLAVEIMRLDPPFRRLGIEVLRKRCGEPPWDFRDHPANRTFLNKLIRAGLDIRPWLDPGSPRAVEAANGERLHLGLAADPLDVLRMGEYFHTCLRPGAFNFFSAVANAADINKRVLIARDERGEVVGRTLLALCDTGGLLVFHHYHRGRALGYERLAAAEAASLAARMKTAPVSYGKVGRLRAPKWYDDGPLDIEGSFPWLDEGSAFRALLDEADPAGILEAARKAVSPLDLNSLTLPPLLMLPEIEFRPELAVPLIETLERVGDAPPEVWLRAAGLLRDAGRVDAARTILARRLLPFQRKELGLGFQDDKILALAAELDPSALLRVLRRTRPRGVRRDEDEPAGRKKFVALAHEALGRAQRAARIMQVRKRTRGAGFS